MTGKRILIIDDDAHVREACVDILKDLGHTTIAVDDGASALTEIARATPDVILLDLLMPRAKVDGLDFLSLIARGPAAQTPVIILSALGATLARHMSNEISTGLNIAAVLAKPVALDTLVQEVARAERVGLSL
jgi:two-component system, OmpR family, response regulator MprA